MSRLLLLWVSRGEAAKFPETDKHVIGQSLSLKPAAARKRRGRRVFFQAPPPSHFPRQKKLLLEKKYLHKKEEECFLWPPVPIPFLLLHLFSKGGNREAKS